VRCQLLVVEGRDHADLPSPPSFIRPVGGIDRSPDAVNEQSASAYVARRIGGQEGHCACDFVGVTPSTEHGVRGVELVDVGQRRLDDARRNRIDADAKAANLRRKALDQEADRRLRATIDREAGIDRNRADRRTSDDASRALLKS
jgi:hypothetical protein